MDKHTKTPRWSANGNMVMEGEINCAKRGGHPMTTAEVKQLVERLEKRAEIENEMAIKHGLIGSKAEAAFFERAASALSLLAQEREELRERVESLQANVQCACAYDEPHHICEAHRKLFARAALKDT